MRNGSLGSRLVLVLAVAWLAGSCGTPRGRSGPHTADGTVAESADSTIVEDVSRSGRPSVVYYWATGCIPCIALGPHVEKLAARYAGRVVFWKLNMGWSAERVRRYGIPVVPTLVFYRDGEEVIRQQGMPAPATDDSLARFIEEGLQSSR